MTLGRPVVESLKYKRKWQTFAWPRPEVGGCGFISWSTWIKAPYKLFLEQFMCEAPPHVLWIMKMFRIVRSSMWKKSFLGHFHILMGNSVPICHHITQIHKTHTLIVTQWTEVLMRFLLRPLNDLMRGGGFCAHWCGGKPLSYLTNTQHLFLLSPYRHHLCWHALPVLTNCAITVYFPIA
jgi:hypothetical protein